MPAALGMLASSGIGRVTVTRALRAAFFSTGDELRSIGQPLGPGDIYDSNRYTLHGMLQRQGVELIGGHFLLHTTFMDAEKHGCDAQWRHQTGGA